MAPKVIKATRVHPYFEAFIQTIVLIKTIKTFYMNYRRGIVDKQKKSDFPASYGDDEN